jgi:hypothetical protein
LARPVLQRTPGVELRGKFFADIRFALGELHVLMIAGAAK